jgi:WD40 repeat protein
VEKEPFNDANQVATAANEFAMGPGAAAVAARRSGRLKFPWRGRSQNANYDAFVSYSHRLDRALAVALQSELQRFARPWYRPRALRIFRDETNLAASPGLWPVIERALEASDWFVLMASPDSAQSVWVQREIEWWLAHRAPDRMLLALTGGEISWEGEDFDWTRTTAIPRSLSGKFADSPLWIDLHKLLPATSDSPGAIWTPHLGDIVAEFAAPIHGKDKDTLVGEHVNYRRRTRRLVRAVIASLSALLLAALVATYVAVDQRNIATTQARIATARQLAATSEAMLGTHLDLAQLLAVEAYRMDQDPQTRSALLQAVTASPALVRYVPVSGQVSAIAGSADGKVVVAGTDSGLVMRWEVAGGAGTKVAQLQGHIASISISAAGSVIAATDGRRAIVWTHAEGAQPVRIPLAKKPQAMAVSPSGRFIALLASTGDSAASGSVTMLDRQTGRTEQASTALVPPSALLMPSDTELLIASADGRWERRSATGLVSNVESTRSPMGVHGFAATASPNGAFFSFTNGGSTIPVWSTTKPASTSGTPDLVALSHGSDPQTIAVSRDGRRVAVADAGTIYISETGARTPGQAAQLTLSGNGSINPNGLTFLGDDNHLLSASGASLTLWDLNQLPRTNRQTRMNVPFGCDACSPPLVELSPDGKEVAVLDGGGSRVVVHGMGQQTDQTLIGDFGDSYGLLGWSTDSTKLFLARPGNSVEIRGSGGAPITGRWPPDYSSYHALALSNGDRSLVELGNNSILVRDLSTRHVERTIRPPGATALYGAVADPAGTVVAGIVVDADLTTSVKLIDVNTGKVQTVGTGDVESVGLSRDHLLVQRKTGELEVWNLAGTILQRSIQQDTSYMPTSTLTPMAVAGALVAQQLSDGAIVVTDIETGEIVATLNLPSTSAGLKTGLAFTPDASQLVSVTESNTLSGNGGLLAQWNLSPSAWIHDACASADRNLTTGEWRKYAGTAPPNDLLCTR